MLWSPPDTGESAPVHIPLTHTDGSTVSGNLNSKSGATAPSRTPTRQRTCRRPS